MGTGTVPGGRGAAASPVPTIPGLQHRAPATVWTCPPSTLHEIRGAPHLYDKLYTRDEEREAHVVPILFTAAGTAGLHYM